MHDVRTVSHIWQIHGTDAMTVETERCFPGKLLGAYGVEPAHAAGQTHDHRLTAVPHLGADGIQDMDTGGVFFRPWTSAGG